MRAPVRILVFSACLALAASSIAFADQKDFKSSSASNVQNMDCSTRAGAFEPFTLGWLVDGNPSVEGGEQMLHCTTRVRDGGAGRKGVKVRLEAEIRNLNGDLISNLGSRTGRTDKNGSNVIDYDLVGFAPNGQNFLTSVEGTYSTRKKIDTADTTCNVIDRVPCQDDNETLCLLDDNRFKVDVDWMTSSESGSGQVLSSGRDTGVFYFFSPNNQDLLVQLLDACGNNDHFWVFYEATTNVEYELTVTDTMTGFSRVYGNDLGQPANAVTDTSAFATCP